MIFATPGSTKFDLPLQEKNKKGIVLSLNTSDFKEEAIKPSVCNLRVACSENVHKNAAKTWINPPKHKK